VTLEAGLLRKAALAERTDEKGIFVLLCHVAVQSRLRRKHLFEMFQNFFIVIKIG
jgi:hypothetical protein